MIAASDTHSQNISKRIFAFDLETSIEDYQYLFINIGDNDNKALIILKGIVDKADGSKKNFKYIAPKNVMELLSEKVRCNYV